MAAFHSGIEGANLTDISSVITEYTLGLKIPGLDLANYGMNISSFLGLLRVPSNWVKAGKSFRYILHKNSRTVNR